MNENQQGSLRGKLSCLCTAQHSPQSTSNPHSSSATAGKVAHLACVVWVAVKTQLEHKSNPVMLLYLLFTKKFRQKK